MSNTHGHFSANGREFVITTPQTPRHFPLPGRKLHPGDLLPFEVGGKCEVKVIVGQSNALKA